MLEVYELITFELKCECPSCGSTEEGFVGDPRGKEFICESCGESYKVSEHADIETR